MTFKELRAIVGNVSDAHLLLQANSTMEPQLVESISIRVDSDGTKSIVLHTEHLTNRVTQQSLQEKKQQEKRDKALLKTVRNSDGAVTSESFDERFIHEDSLYDLLSQSGLKIDDAHWTDIITDLTNGKANGER